MAVKNTSGTGRLLRDAGGDDSHKRLAAATYNAAADSYDAPPLGFWDRFGRRTVERLALPAGARVLDICCGSGASALAAAERVGPTGSVLGLDLAEELLALAWTKARRRGLRNVHFEQGDLEALDHRTGQFDAVVCVFGIFFVPDMAAAVARLMRLVRPGGALAVTTWGPRTFEPANGAFWEAVGREAPALYKAFNPWDRIDDAGSLRALFANARAGEVEVEPEETTHPVATAADWWTIVLGTGYRGTVDQLDPDARERVRRHMLSWIERHGVTAVEANVLYAVARRPA